MSLNQSLQLGEPTIDRQHDELLLSFDRLRHTPAPVSDEHTLELLTTLSQQIYHHFECEEGLMRNMELPAAMLVEHKAAHHAILEGLTQLHLDLMKGRPVSSDELLTQASAWVLGHLVEYDLTLRPYVRHPLPPTPPANES